MDKKRKKKGGGGGRGCEGNRENVRDKTPRRKLIDDRD